MRQQAHQVPSRKRLLCLLVDMDKAEIIALIAWCHDHNMKVSTVAHSLWKRELRDADVRV